MKIHKKLEDLYKEAKPGCDLENIHDGCNWISCGPVPGCTEKFGKIPCKYCGFWMGYGLSGEEIDNWRRIIEMLTKNTDNVLLDFDDLVKLGTAIGGII